MKLSKKIHSQKSSHFLQRFLTEFIIVLLICLAGCMPPKKTKPLTLTQLKKDKDKTLLNILSMGSVRRKDIAFLLVYYFNDLLPFFEKKQDLYHFPNNVIIDIKGLKEEPYIVDALRMGWMRNFPDGKFYPNDEIRRFQLAIILYRVSETLPLFYSNETKRCEIKDVPNSDYTYRAICFVVSNKLLKTKDGFFFKNRFITGYEACRSLSEFRKMLKK